MFIYASALSSVTASRLEEKWQMLQSVKVSPRIGINNSPTLGHFYIEIQRLHTGEEWHKNSIVYSAACRNKRERHL